MTKEALHTYVSESKGNESNICQISAVKDGETVYCDHWRGFQDDDAANVNSVTKGIMALLVGIALDQGLIGSVNQKVLEFFPDPNPAARWMAKVVVREEALRFTMLLPIRMAESILPGFSRMASSRDALAFPWSASPRSRTLLTVVRAVSAEEKKAESSNKMIRIMICRIELASNVVISL